MKNKNTSDITPKQKEILILLYKFRFLNTNQIQILLNHKHKGRIKIWLSDLTEKKYIKRYYSQRFAGSPAIYSLELKSRHYFKENKTDDIQLHLLDRIYQEHLNSFQFKRSCMLLADIYASLLSLTEKNKIKLKFFTKVDLMGMKNLISPEPSAYFAFEGDKKGAKRYFLDVFTVPANRNDLMKRINQYFKYFDEESWQDNTGYVFPEVIMICASYRIRKSLEQIIKKKREEGNENILFYLSTWREVKEKGMSKETLHKVEIS